MNKKESVFKKAGFRTILASVFCAVLGILVGYIVLICINPAHATEAIMAILKNFAKFSGNQRMFLYYMGSTILKAVPLILCGLSVLFAYKAGLFNIGAAGQYTVALCAVLYSAHVWKLSWILCLIIGVLVGALWGAIAGAFKALFNVNEVIACIMLNWIGLYLTNMILSDERCMNPSLSETYDMFENAPQALLPTLGLDKVFGNNKYFTLAVPVTIIIAIVILVVLNKTTFGYELKATGNNREAARYAGMNAKRNIILTMCISGALAGLGAAFFYQTGIENFKTASSVPGMGFSGIAVAFLGGLHPIGTIFAGLFVEHITLGGQYVDTTYYNPQVADLIVAVIIYLCGFVLIIKEFLQKAANKKGTKFNINDMDSVLPEDEKKPVEENKEEVKES